MRKILLLVISLSFYCYAFSQNASTYFPTNTGYKWYYKNTPLDSNNNPVPSLARYRVDTFAVVQSYHGLQASIVKIKDNLLSINQNTPYTDTNYHNFQGTNGWEYVNLSLIPDTTGLPIGVINFFKGLQGWYNVFQFASSVGSSYQILTKDTTISINSVPVQLRVKINAKRLADESVQTVNGTYTAKKFAVTYGLYAVIIIFEQPIVVRADTSWIASGIWMIKEKSPSIVIDLSSYGYGIIPIPGQVYELTKPVGIQNISTSVPDKFELQQNYPNPFNPITNIKFKIKNSGLVLLKVYDAIGKEISTLVNENLNAGEYEARFDGSLLNSGVYFYKISSGEFEQVRKMILVK